MAGSRKTNQGSVEQASDDSNAVQPQVDSFSEAEEIKGSLAHSEQYDKLMRSVLENDKDHIEEGQVIADGINQGMQSFTPDLLFEQLTKDYKQAKQIHGERLIRELSGYDPSYVERNIRIPEFKRELKERLQQGVKSLQDKGYLDKEGRITDEGVMAASISLVSDELEKLRREGILGERTHKISADHGDKSGVRNYRGGDRYRDLALKATAKRSIRRGHTQLRKEDLVVHERTSKERAVIIYAVDASGSMRGGKIGAAKRAGIALAYQAIQKNDKVGCLVFGKQVEMEQAPTKDFPSLVRLLVRARASQETDIALTVRHAINLFGSSRAKRHLILLTDGLQTVGKHPEKEVMEAVQEARNADITISVIGLSLDKEGESLSQKIVNIGRGALYAAKSYDDLDLLLIEDYYRFKG